jgi:hypothetical protein
MNLADVTRKLIDAIDEEHQAKDVVGAINWRRVPEIFEALGAPMTKSGASVLATTDTSDASLQASIDVLARHGDGCVKDSNANRYCRRLFGLLHLARRFSTDSHNLLYWE